MARRTVSVNLGGENPETINIEVTACPCQIDDLQMAIQAFLVGWKRERDQFVKAKSKPCGCKDAG